MWHTSILSKYKLIILKQYKLLKIINQTVQTFIKNFYNFSRNQYKTFSYKRNTNKYIFNLPAINLLLSNEKLLMV